MLSVREHWWCSCFVRRFKRIDTLTSMLRGDACFPEPQSARVNCNFENWLSSSEMAWRRLGAFCAGCPHQVDPRLRRRMVAPCHFYLLALRSVSPLNLTGSLFFVPGIVVLLERLEVITSQRLRASGSSKGSPCGSDRVLESQPKS